MSYAISAALQAAIYDELIADTALGNLVGDAIYDAMPTGTLPDTYVTLGPEEVRNRSDISGGGAWHFLTISAVTSNAGFSHAKAVAAAITDALIDAELTLSRGRLVGLHFYRGKAQRDDNGALRRIDLIFRARVDDAD